MVGRDARMRVSSEIRPSLIGTLKSTRMNAFLPERLKIRHAASGQSQSPFFTMKRSKSTQRLE